MNRLFILLLLAAALFWLLGRKTHTLTLPATGQHAPVMTGKPSDILEIRIPDADMAYYDVSGTSAAEIRDNLDRQHANGGFDAFTGWNVHWNWPGFGQADCDLGNARLDTELHVRLPRWQPPRHADPALVLKWNSYLGSLAFHEQGHVQLARQGFAKMQQILHDSSCTEADASLNAVLAEMRRADLRYDAETRHGITQGARFP